MDLLGAIGAAGDAADKITGGRALRGVLAGKGRELASVVPFSDSIGLTSERDKTSGRDLTDMYGLTSKGSNSFGSNAAGFLADSVLSPGNLIGAYGAFRAAPTIAKGITGAGKALTGLDLLDHLKGVGRGASSLPGSTDPVEAYNRLTAHFPQPLPLQTHRVPDAIRRTPSMSLLDEMVGAHRQNKRYVDQRTATSGLGDLYHAHQTTLPGTALDSPSFGQGPRFSNPVHHTPTSASGERISDDMWARMMGDQGPKISPAMTFFRRQSAPVLSEIPKGFPTVADSPAERAIRIGNAAGVPTRMPSAFEANMTIGKNNWGDIANKVGAWYSGTDHAISLNPHFVPWNSPNLMGETVAVHGPSGKGWWSSSSPDHLINHELGHAMHRESLGVDAFHDPRFNQPYPEGSSHRWLASNLSQYGASNRAETIAELVAALKAGRQLDPTFVGVLKSLGGNNLFENLGDQGLLKGLGLSALLGAGMAGAYSGGPQQPQQPG
jgi:hypothetical protein